MKYVHDIVTIAKNRIRMFQQILQLNHHLLLILPIVCENPKDTESNTSKDTNMYITVGNELVEISSKRQKTLSPLTSQTINTITATLDYGASCNYTIIANNLTMNLKEFANPNWESHMKCTMPD